MNINSKHVYLLMLCYLWPYAMVSKHYNPLIQFNKQSTIWDVSQLTTTSVKKIATPITIEELTTLVKNADAPIAIAGGRFSQGGQIAYPDGIVIDMKHLNAIVHLDVEKKEVTVQAGITWYDLLKVLDQYNLSAQVMQSFCNFTVGGSLSVNCHGRHIHNDPLITSVQSITVLLADGSLCTASRTENQELFSAAIGGYGGVGIIVETTLQLTENYALERKISKLPFVEYKEFFLTTIKNDFDAVLHSAYLFGPDYDTALSVTFYKTKKAVTISEHLQQQNDLFIKDRLGLYALTRIPGLNLLRPKIETWQQQSEVVWRNFELSYSTNMLEMLIRFPTTHILQEYFIPVAHIEEFIAQFKTIVKRHRINMVNVALRFVAGNNESLLSYAPQDSFAVVCYINMVNTDYGKKQAKKWTRKLIDAALSCNGTYYLPYQLYATQEQLHAAYPRFKEFMALKYHFDPKNRFSNNFFRVYG